MFLADFRANVVKGDKSLEDKLLLDQWVYEPGVPPNVARPDPAAFAQVDKAVAAFSAGGAAPTTFDKWTTAEKLRFINSLPRKLPAARLDELNGKLRLNDAGNNEVLFAWLDLAVGNRYQAAVPTLERFLTVQGRRKFVRPLITDLAKDSEWGRPIASRIYAIARPSYHSVTATDLDKLGLIAAGKSAKL
jgi:hypothetical protein